MGLNYSGFCIKPMNLCSWQPTWLERSARPQQEAKMKIHNFLL